MVYFLCSQVNLLLFFFKGNIITIFAFRNCSGGHSVDHYDDAKIKQDLKLSENI